MKHRGMALLTGLLLLAAISLLALVGTSSMILQTQMASNFKHNTTALQNANLAQSEGEAWLFSRPSHEREPDCITDCLLPTAIHHDSEIPAHLEYESVAWWQLNGIEAGMDPATGLASAAYQFESSQAPRWIIEELRFEPVELEPPFEATQGVGYYRIFSRGSGGNSRSVAITEVIVARPWGDGVLPGEYPLSEDSVNFCLQFEGISHPLFDCGSKAWRQRR